MVTVWISESPWLTGTAAGLVVGITVAVSAAAFHERPEPAAPAKPEAEAKGHRTCDALLAELHAEWKPWKRAELIERARRQRDLLVAPLLQHLRRAGSEHHPGAVLLVGELAIREARPVLESLCRAGHPRVRALAIAAAHKIRAWSRAELAAFLEQKEEPLVLARVLELLSASGLRPPLAIFPLLGHPDKDVREAALGNIPPRLDRGEEDALFTFLLEATGPGLEYGVRALGSTRLTVEMEAYLVSLLGGHGPRVDAAALDALARKSSPLKSPQYVLEFAMDPGFDTLARARAFHCLEETGSPVAIRGWEIDSLEPYLRYFAGRCLLESDPRTACDRLLAILRISPAEETEEDHRRLLQAQAYTRQLFSALTGTSPYVDPETWSTWCGQRHRLDTSKLPASPMSAPTR